jgi:hypothetical protein
MYRQMGLKERTIPLSKASDMRTGKRVALQSFNEGVTYSDGGPSLDGYSCSGFWGDSH